MSNAETSLGCRYRLGISRLQQLLQLLALEGARVPALAALLLRRRVRPAQVGAQLQRVHAPAVVAHRQDRVAVVELRVRQPRALHHLLLAERLVLVLGQVVHVHLAVRGRGRKHRGRVRAPGHVAHRVAQVEAHHRVLEVVVPELDGPVGAAAQEHALVEGVPPQRVHGHVVPLVGLQVLPRVGLAALVHLALLGAHHEQVLGRAVEVEAAAARQPGERGLLGVVARGGHQPQLHHGLHLQLVLAHDPVGHAPVAGHRVEVQLLGQVLLLPVHLPDRVCVLARLDGGRVDRLVTLVPHVVHHHRPVVAAHGQQRGVLRVEVQAERARLRGEQVLRVRRVLQREEADRARALPEEVVAAVRGREQVRVPRVPPQRRHLDTRV
mmetsp:Transcript_26159/g.41185  ORF Transcript_26159/g.41185 Transcript_26159/m.41185 type:complete len:381 (+) Transcript_26159:242-1384(+)